MTTGATTTSFRTARSTLPVAWLATPEEVAAGVVCVCSPQASAANAAALHVDGGAVRSIA